jgi:hypothetical protein
MRLQLQPWIDNIHSAPDDRAAVEANPTANFGTTTYWRLDEIAMLGRLTQDERALEAARRVLRGLANIPMGTNQKHTGWGGLKEVALAYDLTYETLLPADRSSIATWMIECGLRGTLQQLRGSYLRNSGANTPICGMISAFFYLLATEGEPAIPNLTRERGELLHMLDATLHSAHGPQGYPVEDIGYGTGITPYLAVLVEAVRRAGIYDAYRQCPRFARFGRAILHFVQPWGEHLSNTGDASDILLERVFILGRLAAATRDRTLAWLVGTLGLSSHPHLHGEIKLGSGFRLPASYLSLLVLDELKHPVAPARAKLPTHFADRGRGIVSFRSGWEPDATCVVFDGSQRSSSAQGHAHDSCGHFSLTALGEYFAIDTGRYNIEQACHNVVLIDGKSGRSTEGEWRMSYYHGLLTRYRPGAFCDFAAVDSSHQHNCYWARRYLGLVKGGQVPAYAWVVEDINKANDWAEFWWQLHTSPENRIAISGASATIQGWRRGNLLDVHFILPPPGRYPKPHTLTLVQDEATSSSYKYVGEPHHFVKRFARPADALHHSVQLGPRLLGKVAGYNGRFLSLLIPRHKGQPPPRVEPLPSLDNSLAVRIVFANVEDTVLWSYEHNLLEAGGVKARGQWCVVRRLSRNGRILARESGNETGQAIVATAGHE